MKGPRSQRLNQQARYLKPRSVVQTRYWTRNGRISQVSRPDMDPESPIGADAIASHGRLSGRISARSGSRRTSRPAGRCFTGLAAQRVNKVSDDFYAADRTITQYFNRAAFAQPAPGTLGDLERNAAVGPNFWNVDVALSRLVALGATHRLELRLESFNLLNHLTGSTRRELHRGQLRGASRRDGDTYHSVRSIRF